MSEELRRLDRDAVIETMERMILTTRAEAAMLRQALRFYARHEHWMAIHESPDTPNRLLVANGRAAEAGHGWEEAEAALAAEGVSRG